MPVPGSGVRAGSVPLDALDAEELADLLGDAAEVIGVLAGDPAAEAVCAASGAGGRTMVELHIDLAIAAAGLEEAIDTHTGILHP